MKFPTVNLGVPMPRLLPLTIVVMAALLVAKSIDLVRAAAPAAAETAPAQPPAAQAAPATASAAPSTPASAIGATQPPATAAGAAAKPGPMLAAAEPKPAERAAPPVGATERKLLLDLRKRRDELDAREAALNDRERVLSAAETRLTTRLAELANLQQRLESLESERKQREEAQWAGLVKLYESMKPHDAATIFDDLDLPVLLPIMDRMNDRKAALVLAAMLPERARVVTTELARMRARANAVPPPTPAAAAATSSGKTTGGG